MATLQRSVFRWLHLVDARRGVGKAEKAHSQITIEDVATKYGVPDDILIDHIEAEIHEAETFQTLPFTLVMMIAFTWAVYMHDPVVPVNAVEDSIAFDINENANFAFAGPWIGHKDINDVNSHADFWSWLIRGFMPLIFQQGTSWSEGTDVEHPLIVANTKEFPRSDRGQLLNYNRIVGGIRMRQERSNEKCKSMQELLVFYDKECVGGHGYELYPEVYPGFGAHVTTDPVMSGPGAEFWLWAHEDYDKLLDIVQTKETSSRWLDESTRKIEIAMPCYNAMLGIHSLIKVNFYFSRGGHIWKRIIGMSTFAEFYHHMFFDFIPDLIWLACVVYMVVVEVRLMGHHITVEGYRGLRSKYLNFWSVMDWLSIIVGFALMAMFALRYRGSVSLNKRLFMLVELDESTSQANYRAKAMEYIELLESEVQSLYTFRVLVGMYPLFIMFRLFKAFAAQPRLSIVTRTLGNASVDLIHFLLVFLSIFCTYAVAGVILFGREVDDFTTFPRSMVTSFRAMMGDFDWDELSRVGRLEGFMWFGTFVVIIVLLMLNMLLAIVMDTYAEVKEELGEAETLINELKQTVVRWRGHRNGTVTPLKEMLKAIRNNKADFEVFTENLAEDSPERLKNMRRSQSVLSSTDTVADNVIEYAIVTIDLLTQICPRMSHDQALETIKVAADKYYKNNKEKVDVEELLLAMRKVDYSTKKMKGEVKHMIDVENAIASQGNQSGGKQDDEGAMPSFLDELNTCRLELRKAKDWIGNEDGNDGEHDADMGFEASQRAGTTGEATPEMGVTEPAVTPWSVRYVLNDHESILAACRAAGISTKNDALRLQCAGLTVKVIEVDASDGTVKCRAPGIGDVWFGVGALTSHRSKQRESVTCSPGDGARQESTSPAGNVNDEHIRRKKELEEELQAGRQTVSEALAAVSELEWALYREQEEKDKLAQKFQQLKSKVAELSHENGRLVEEVKKQEDKHERVGNSREEYFDLARQMVDENQRLKALLKPSSRPLALTDAPQLPLSEVEQAHAALAEKMRGIGVTPEGREPGRGRERI